MSLAVDVKLENLYYHLTSGPKVFEAFRSMAVAIASNNSSMNPEFELGWGCLTSQPLLLFDS